MTKRKSNQKATASSAAKRLTRTASTTARASVLPTRSSRRTSPKSAESKGAKPSNNEDLVDTDEDMHGDEAKTDTKRLRRQPPAGADEQGEIDDNAADEPGGGQTKKNG